MPPPPFPHHKGGFDFLKIDRNEGGGGLKNFAIKDGCKAK